jgi:hypothetical protein
VFFMAAAAGGLVYPGAPRIGIKHLPAFAERLTSTTVSFLLIRRLRITAMTDDAPGRITSGTPDSQD